MRLQTELKDVVRSGVAQSSEFKIKATAKAFGILSSGLYSDKILAIVRELSCNAYDSHVAAGKRDLPIEVKLPTALEPTFYIKDYGTGLDHEGVTQLYTTYFESSKADSNDFIGALGLGSKSPFSYTNNFTVEARHNGTKRLYACIINEQGVPEINQQGEQKTDEPNGLTVSLAAKREDVEKFKTAAQRAFIYFTPVPSVVGVGDFKPYSLKHTVNGTNWKLREITGDTEFNGARVVQGFVSYPIDAAALRSNGLTNLGCNILNQNIDFYVPIGDVDVAASREALQYNKHTITNLITAIGFAEKEMRVSIQKQFDDCKSLWDARLLHVELASWRGKTHAMYDELSKRTPFKYQSTAIDDTFKLDLTNITQTQVQVVYQQHWGKRRVRSAGEWSPAKPTKVFEFAVRPGMTVLVDDTFKSKQALPLYLTSLPQNRSGDDKYCVVIKPIGRGLYNSTEVQAITKQLGCTKIEYVSQLPLPAKVTKQYTYKARKNDEALVWCGFPKNGGYKKDQLRRVYSRLCWNGEQVDLYGAKEEQFYVEIDRFSIVYGKASEVFTQFDTFLEEMQQVGALRSKLVVHGLTDKQIRLIKGNMMWLNVFDEAKRRFAEINKTGDLTNKVIADRVLTAVGEGIARHVVTNWTDLSTKLTKGSFSAIINKINDVNNAGKSCKLKIDNIMSASRWVNKQFAKDVEDTYKKLVEEFAVVMEQYAMLKLVDWNKVGRSDLDMIVEYVNYVGRKV